jgi:hypothetical protein
MAGLVSGGVAGADGSVSGEEDFSAKLAADNDAICGEGAALLWAKLSNLTRANDNPKSSEMRKVWAAVLPLREIKRFMVLSSM